MSNARHTPETEVLVATQFDDRMPMMEAYPQMVAHARKLESQRDELLAALEKVWEQSNHLDSYPLQTVEQARAALAAKGEK